MSTHADHADPRAAAGASATCRGKGDQCENETAYDDLCLECVYDEIVLEQPTICRRCFRRKHHVELVSSTNRRRAVVGDLNWTVDEDDGIWKLEGKLYFRTDETERDFPPPKTDEDRPVEQTVCACGDFDGAVRTTLSRKQALTHAERLSERLDELDVEHDPEALLDCVDDLKHRPATAGKDQPVFREAVATAIESES